MYTLTKKKKTAKSEKLLGEKGAEKRPLTDRTIRNDEKGAVCCEASRKSKSVDLAQNLDWGEEDSRKKQADNRVRQEGSPL